MNKDLIKKFNPKKNQYDEKSFIKNTEVIFNINIKLSIMINIFF